MTTAAIIKEIKKLPVNDRLLVIEKTLKSIRQQKEDELTAAADALYDEYKTNKELTAFSKLDSQTFYEAR